MYLLRRTDQRGGYVAKPGLKSYTNDIKEMRKFDTREEAERERCVDNEIIVPIEEALD